MAPSMLEHGVEALLHFVVTSLCVAVEHSSATTDTKDGGHSCASALDALLRTYNEAMWKLPLERELKALNDWSLVGSTGQSAAFYRDIAYPVVVVSLLVQPPSAPKSANKKPLRRRALGATNRHAAPALFQLSRIVEDPLEARWDHRGDPVPLRRNVLGRAYAPRSDPLQFVRQSRATPAAHIFQQVKRVVRADSVDREKHRIQALNDREALRKYELLAAQHGSSEPALTPEDALEAKLDRLLLGNGENNAPLSARAADGDHDKGDDTDGKADDDDSKLKDDEDAESDNQDYAIFV